MIISIREAFFGNKKLQNYKPEGPDWVHVFSGGKITPEMEPYKDKVEKDGTYAYLPTPNGFVSNHDSIIRVRAVGGRWNHAGGSIYYSPSLDFSFMYSPTRKLSREEVFEKTYTYLKDNMPETGHGFYGEVDLKNI